MAPQEPPRRPDPARDHDPGNSPRQSKLVHRRRPKTTSTAAIASAYDEMAPAVEAQ